MGQDHMNSSDPSKRSDLVRLSAVTAQREQNQCRHTNARALGRLQRAIPYSGKLSREKTFLIFSIPGHQQKFSSTKFANS